ncbi:LysM peptidoglycan-binding domain-containing protein [Alicyclobacillus acidoterrestris]|uniref:LysM domain-containing protein n=1 Tax=Alicyclobacillus acidoterrestris (strain ATCC 49025 / DSM 3922 / CIP 106132 / NCIMB 13137 / GD3B) TaxID=1356854 RepID=T0BIL6_ALIAG|nr:LysM domain-containing protein [Alicyclobacillus acidoterrestris]EPZ43828.1 hypothetical protein N007_11970 [Alicyclobacillus acidoterrestris ATCC 49025]UNO49040.1 LysM domain-containing protein [Alicyclobacillus acidoterrestris]
MTTLKEVADLGAQKTGLPSRFICAWFYAENGENLPQDNNFANISYSGSNLPSDGVFRGAVNIQPNHVVTYGTWEDGLEAWATELAIPVGPTKWLTLDLEQLKACNGNVEQMAKLVGESNWATSHYDDGRGPGSLIIDAYNNTVIEGWYANVPTARPEQLSVTVQAGQTLSGIADEYRIPLGVLQRYNAIPDANKIDAGQKLLLPIPHTVHAGDTLSNLALTNKVTVALLQRVNSIEDPNKIYVGQVLWV